MRRKSATKSSTDRGGRLPAAAPLLITAAAAALVVISSLGPWARVSTEAYVGAGASGVTVRGIAVDGGITLVLGAIAAGLLGWRLARPQLGGYALAGSLVLLFTSGVLAVTNLLDVGNASGDFNAATLPAAGQGFIRTGENGKDYLA